MILPYRKHIIEKELEKYSEFIPKDTKINLYTSVDSTNTLLKDRALHGASEGEVIIAYHQTAGRGRMGRRFYSPCDTGIYISILLRPELLAKDGFLITTSAGVASARALESVGSPKIGIKWVNDIFIGNKKVGGILAESVPLTNSKMLDFAVLGIGINVFEPSCGFPEDIKDIASSVFLKEGKRKYLREKIAGRIIGEFFRIYKEFPSASFMDEYRQRSVLTGKEVIMSYGDSQFAGTVIGIDLDGCLCVKGQDGEIRKFSTGEARAKMI